MNDRFNLIQDTNSLTYSTIIYGKGRKRKFDQRRGQKQNGGQEDKEQHYIKN
jgi:hypothetical protein